MTFDLQEHAARLEEFTRQETWREVLRPAVRQQMRRLEGQIARGLKTDLAEIRERQMRYAVLAALLDDPAAFFRLEDE